MTLPHHPAPPHLPVPEGIELLSGIEKYGDPRLMQLQELENWIRIYRAHATRILREVWAEDTFKESVMREATSLSREGLRRRADPEYAAAVNSRRRKTPEDTP